MLRATVFATVLLTAGLWAAGGTGFDSGANPTELVRRLGSRDDLHPAPIGEWLRIRGFVHAPVWGDADVVSAANEKIDAMREALDRLRGANYQTVCYLRWERVWPSGARSGEAGGNRSPLDLRGAYRRGYAFGRTYGDLVDAWEIENEPDAGFFADNADVFAAFYKAIALGLAAGRRAAQGAETGVLVESTVDGTMPGQTLGRERSLIVMPPLVLPPGPYLEQLRANGFLAYTEGANLHYYGFSNDYSGAVLRLRDALQENEAEEGRAARNRTSGFGVSRRSSVSGFRLPVADAPALRRMPLFVTEWGYPRLDGYAAQTVEGRIRQWRYYRDVTLQNERLGVHAPMAFYLPPYFEYGAKEFGLTMPADEKREAHFGFRVDDGPGKGVKGVTPGDQGPEGRNSGAPDDEQSGEAEVGRDLIGEVFHAGGLGFSPADFGAEGPEKWMTRIGEKIGGNEASPAMAWMMDRAGRRVPPEFVRIGPRGRAERRYVRDRGDWLVRTEAPSPVVMDLVAGEGMQAVKSFCGYVLDSDVKGAAGGTRSGTAKLVFYHFGTETAEIALAWPRGMRPASGEDQTPLRLKLEPGDRREVDVALSVPDGAFRANELSLVAEVQSGGARTRSRWATRLYPHPSGMVSADARSFVFPANTASGNCDWLLREQAEEEAQVAAQGRWLVTPGVVVEETPTRWRFHVSALPPEPMRPARAELPLPDDWAPWERGLVMGFAYRSLPEAGASALRADDPDPLRRLRTGKLGDTLEFFLRTRAGNVYCVQSPSRPTAEWVTYNQPAETLTPGFPGRQAAPLKIDKERPASLVFFFRPAALPTVYEIDRPQLAHWRKSE